MKNKTLSVVSKVILYLLLFGLMVIILLLSIFLLTSIFNKSEDKPLISIFTIVSPSMEPTIKIYDCIINIRVNSDKELNENDIITFYSNYVDSEGYTITHRIIKKYEVDGKTHYITKGDNNIIEDEGSITLDDIVGKNIAILPKMGKFEFFFTSNYGWLFIVCVPLVGFIIYHIVKLIKLLRRKNI